MKILMKGIGLFGIIMLFALALPMGNTGAADTKQNIDISLSPSTLFIHATNMKPGDTVTSTITVKNKGTVDFEYFITVHRKDGSDKFYKKLGLKIFDSNGLIYEGKLSDLHQLKMGSLAKFSQEDLKFSVLLPYDTGNAYQGLSTKVGLEFATGAPAGASTGSNQTSGGNSQPAEGSEDTNKGGAQPNSNSDFPLLGSILPQTGETDPAYFYIAGLIIVLGGLALFTVKRRPHRK